MSLNYGFKDRHYESDKILRRVKRHLNDDPKLSISGGKMSGDIDMALSTVKNIADPVNDLDAISKKVLESVYLSQYFKTQSYNILFDFNTTKYTANTDLSQFYHSGTNKVKAIGDKANTLVQNDPTYGPMIGTNDGHRFLSPELTPIPLEAGIHFNCPRMQYCDISVFVVVRLAARVSTKGWEAIISNDDGSWDKYIGYKGGTIDKLSYGGGAPAKEYTCTIPNNIDTTKRHMISIHWQMDNSHVRVNNVKSTDFTANYNEIGYPYGTIFGIHRPRSSLTPYAYPSLIEFYGMKIISGYMKNRDVLIVGGEMMKEYNIK